jgi:hypothetical protein
MRRYLLLNFVLYLLFFCSSNPYIIRTNVSSNQAVLSVTLDLPWHTELDNLYIINLADRKIVRKDSFAYRKSFYFVGLPPGRYAIIYASQKTKNMIGTIYRGFLFSKVLSENLAIDINAGKEYSLGVYDFNMDYRISDVRHCEQDEKLDSQQKFYCKYYLSSIVSGEDTLQGFQLRSVKSAKRKEKIINRDVIFEFK